MVTRGPSDPTRPYAVSVAIVLPGPIVALAAMTEPPKKPSRHQIAIRTGRWKFAWASLRECPSTSRFRSVSADVIRLSERLVYWMEAHPKWRPNPDWPEQVCSVLYSTPDALVLIDPLIRSDLDTSAWDWLEGIVAAASSPVVVLLTAPWHERSTREVAERYAADVWAHPSARKRLAGLANIDAVPEGIEIVTLGGVDEGQVAFLIEAERTLVVAEFFLGTATGLRVLPSPATVDMAAFVQSLRELGELPIERVLVAHGPSVLAEGRSAVKAALGSFVASAPQKS